MNSKDLRNAFETSINPATKKAWGKCPSKKDGLDPFRAWRKAFRAVRAEAKKAGTFEAGTRCSAKTNVMLGGKPFTSGMARRFVEMTGGVYDSNALTEAVKAHGYTFTLVEGTPVGTTLFTIAATPKAEKASTKVTVDGKVFTKRDAHAVFAASKFAVVAHPEALKAGMLAHGYTYTDSGALVEPKATEKPAAPAVEPKPEAPVPPPPASAPRAKDAEAKAAVQPVKRQGRSGKKGEQSAKNAA